MNEITTIVLLCRDQLKITTDRIMNQQSQQPTATGAGAQSTSVPSQSVDFASPRPAGKISKFQELSIFLSEALIFASTNPQYDDILFIELQV